MKLHWLNQYLFPDVQHDYYNQKAIEKIEDGRYDFRTHVGFW